MKPLPLKLGRGRERGIVMVIVLIGIVAMTLAGIALVRGTQTSSMIAGNFAFKQASLAATDTAIEGAFSQLDTIVAGLADANYPSGCALGACTYYTTRQATDINGVPTAVGDWSTVPTALVNTSYTTQYVIDRLCTGTLPVTDPAVSCFVGKVAGGGNSHKPGSPIPFAKTEVYYRVTVRVSGPRNTVSFAQAIVSK